MFITESYFVSIVSITTCNILSEISVPSFYAKFHFTEYFNHIPQIQPFSNGGFMTLKMIIAYPQMFAAAYPICEALADEFISDSDINRVKNIPIWFTHAVNDPIVVVNKYTEATYQRLMKAGAKDVHFSCFPSVTDRTGKYVNQDRTPYEYNEHFSWIPALNDECILDFNNDPIYKNGKSVTLFEWLATQKRNLEKPQ